MKAPHRGCRHRPRPSARVYSWRHAIRRYWRLRRCEHCGVVVKSGDGAESALAYPPGEEQRAAILAVRAPMPRRQAAVRRRSASTTPESPPGARKANGARMCRVLSCRVTTLTLANYYQAAISAPHRQPLALRPHRGDDRPAGCRRQTSCSQHSEDEVFHDALRGARSSKQSKPSATPPVRGLPLPADAPGLNRSEARRRKAPPGNRALPDFVTTLAGPDEGAAGAHKQSAQLAVEGRGHSRRCHHRHRLHALGKNVQLSHRLVRQAISCAIPGRVSSTREARHFKHWQLRLVSGRLHPFELHPYQ